MTSWVPFLCGIAGGAATTLFFLSFLFLKLEQLLARVVGRKEARLRRRVATVASGEASLWKVEEICRMARYDGDIMGPVILVRAVLFGKTISVYRIDRSHRSDDGDHTIIEAEHLIGKINAATVTSTSEKLSKYHRHTDTTTRQAPLRGKCLILRRKEGQPLFQEDPVLQLSRQQRRQQRQQEEEEAAKRRDHPHHHRHHQHRHRVDDHGVGEGGSAEGGGEAQRGDVDSDENGLMRPGALDLDELDNDESFDAWTAVLFKFPTRRELERWYNLLQATPQSEEWRVFIKHLPSLDAFNLVVARLFFENTRTSGLQDLLIGKIRRKLRRVSCKLPKHIHGEILLTQLELGGEIPLIRGVGEPTVSPNGEVELDFDFLYRGGLKLGLRFAITFRGVRVPDIIFNIKILELSSHMRLSVGPPPSAKIWVGAPRPPQLRLEFAQEVASHDGILNAVLKLMPDMSDFASNVVKVMLFEDMVLPSMEDLPLPCFSYSPPPRRRARRCLTRTARAPLRWTAPRRRARTPPFPPLPPPPVGRRHPRSPMLGRRCRSPRAERCTRRCRRSWRRASRRPPRPPRGGRRTRSPASHGAARGSRPSRAL
ncbi:uncharacterized protein Tco025E_01328 [Trypanosoma conorhini]|uniref:SMP-LTD domain-containing protein n=1 Tax=Trypanosoma conorhini TaxID=83891 RepID=A0A422Q8R5_9TRYP|nr:uncharacterized protein Tco025E_01328 [Trypanosoma conorhini]RNF26368.1 hypothetical protein Tco025E_01328 [Trypanosoma conorhini]